MLGLLVTALVLPFVALRQSQDDFRRHKESEFRSAVSAHVSALREEEVGLDAHLLRFDSYLQHARTLESFVAYSSREDSVRSGRLYMWAQPVKHAERAAFEAAVTAEHRAFLNSSTWTFTITDEQNDTESVHDSVVAPARSEYIPLTYVDGLNDTFPLSLIGRDMLSSGAGTRDVIERAQLLRTAQLSRRRAYPTSSGYTYMHVLLAHAVFDIRNTSSLLGFLMLYRLPHDIVRYAMRTVEPVSLHLGVYDMTGDDLDETGCLLPLMFSATRDVQTGEWIANGRFPSCPGNPAALAQGYLSANIDFGGRSWMFIFKEGPDFDPDPSELSAMTIMTSLAAVLAVLSFVGVLSHGWWLIGHLVTSTEKVTRANRRTKDFLAFISHELRNPLFAVLGTAGELHSSLKRGADQHSSIQLVSSIEAASERMSSILNDVLSVRKLEEGKMEFDASPTSLREVAEEVFTMFATRAQVKGVQLTVSITSGVPALVLGDAGRLVQVLSNLVSNSIKFTQPGGSIWIRMHAVSLPQWMRQEREEDAAQTSPKGSMGSIHAEQVVPLANLRCVQLQVEDTGVGISAAAMPHLFQPYTQESARIARRNGGTGLGMSICKQLVEGMGGEVIVESAKGAGTSVSALLPFEIVRSPPVDPVLSLPGIHELHEPAASEANYTPSADMHAHLPGMSAEGSPMSNSRAEWSFFIDSERTGTEAQTVAAQSLDARSEPPETSSSYTDGRMLVVDDQPINVRIISRLLGRFLPLMRIDSASNGKEAVDMVLQAREPYAIVFMDVIMPTMDGRQATQELRARGCDVPIIAVTGSSDSEELQLNQAAGFTETAVKPLRSATLLSLLRKYVSGQGVVVETRDVEAPVWARPLRKVE